MQFIWFDKIWEDDFLYMHKCNYLQRHLLVQRMTHDHNIIINV